MKSKILSSKYYMESKYNPYYEMLSQVIKTDCYYNKNTNTLICRHTKNFVLFDTLIASRWNLQEGRYA